MEHACMHVLAYASILFLSCVGVGFLFIMPVGAATWTVDDDGPADFQTIQEAVKAASDGDTIQVASGIYYGCVRVDNKTLSLMGEERDTTIIDGNVTETCISVWESRNVVITGFTLRNSQAQHRAGIWASRCLYINVTGNMIVNNENGIDLAASDGSTIVGNTITENSRYGILLNNSGNNTLRNNKMTGNQYNFYVDSVTLDKYAQDIDVSNLVDGRPIVYLVNERDVTVRDAGLVVAINCINITVENLNLAKNYIGVDFSWTHNSTIRQTTLSSNMYGVYLFQSHDNLLDNNVITGNYRGIKSSWSHRNTFNGNTICHNTKGGTHLVGSEGNLFYHNNFINNTEHVKEEFSSENFWLDKYTREGNYWEGEVYVGDVYPLSRPWGLLGLGDISLDGVVDIFDVVLVANAFGSESGDPNWNLLADLVQDEVIDIFDVVLLAQNFGKTVDK